MRPSARNGRGMTLVELMVGLAVGVSLMWMASQNPSQYDTRVARSLPVGGVVFLPTALAPRLPAPARGMMERRHGSAFAASTAYATLFHVAMIAN